MVALWCQRTVNAVTKQELRERQKSQIYIADRSIGEILSREVAAGARCMTRTLVVARFRRTSARLLMTSSHQ